MDTLKVNNFGPIREAEVTFGDLTILIGPQASGKSLFLELFKLIVDRKHIISTLRKYNYILRKEDASQLLEFYFGEGMGGILRNDTVIEFSGEEFGKDTLQTAMKKSGSSQPPEMVF